MQDQFSDSRWVIVLAGGEGERMRPLTARWFGNQRPKQYCAFTGTRSMLEHTLDRATRLAHKDRILTVVGKNHRAFLEDLREDLPGRVIEQPERRDTAPGVFLPLSHVMAADPSATVLIFPSDHYIYPEECFVEHVRRATLLADRLEDQMVLLAALPDRPESDYGWIQSGQVHSGYVWSSRLAPSRVVSFHEKPSPTQAEDFYARGYLWNTLILVTKARTLWNLGQALLPGLMDRFESFRKSLNRAAQGLVSREEQALALTHLYRKIGSINFSTDVLQRIPERLAVLPLVDVEWSDWGTPERLLETLEKLNRLPLAAPQPELRVFA